MRYTRDFLKNYCMGGTVLGIYANSKQEATMYPNTNGQTNYEL